MKKVNIFTILALVALLIGYFIPGIAGSDINNIVIINLVTAVVALAFSIASIVYAKKIEKSKAFGIVLLVISILGVLLFGILAAFLSIAKDPEKNADICKQVVNCEKGTDNTSTCYLDSDSTKILPIKCYDTNLTSGQYK